MFAYSADLYVPSEYATIQAAINASSNGDVIRVASGTYNESISISKSVTLLGANAGIHPAIGTHPTEVVGVRNAETILSKTNAIRPSADNIKIDGFKFTGTGARIIDTYSNANYFHLTNCIFYDTTTTSSIAVIQFGGGSHTDCIFDFNLFHDMRDQTLYFGGGPYDSLKVLYNKFNVYGSGIFWTATPMVDGVIKGNEFDGVLNAVAGEGSGALNIGQGGNINISDNYFHDMSYSAFQVGIIGGTITNNKFERIYPYLTYGANAFELWGGEWGTSVSTNVVISDNTIIYNDILGASYPSHGVRLRGPGSGASIDAETIHLYHNRFLGEGVRSDAYAVRHQGNQNTYLDADSNHWGTMDGMKIDSMFITPVKYSPWCNYDFTDCGNIMVLVLDSSQLRFGNVVVGSFKRDSITITNNMSSDLVLSNISNSNQYFSVSLTSTTITAHSTQKIYVVFAPMIDGLQTDYLLFQHSETNKIDSIPISGTGVSPKFTANPINLYFQNVINGVSKKDSIMVTNTGLAELIITSVTSSNELFTVTPISASIPPGVTKKFFVTYSPLVDGMKNGYIYFNHNAQNAKDSVFVSGTGVSPKFTVSPINLNFGDVYSNITKIDSVTVTNTGTADLIITAITSSNYHFTVTEHNATIKSGASKKFYITFTPLTYGTVEGYIRFKFNASNAKDSIYVTGTGIGNPVAPEFSISSISLNFGNVINGTNKLDSVTITNTGDANLIIYNITSDNIYYNISPRIINIIPGGSQKVFITFAPLIPGVENGNIYFYHNSTNLIDSIQVTGTGVGVNLAPIFNARPNLDFGTVYIGITKQISITVTNTGSSDLIISDIISSDEHYIITPIVGTIAPNSSQEFFISFEPTEAGLVNAEIRFSHNAGISVMMVSGRGLLNISVISIEEARGLEIGTEFVVEGIVTRTMGKYTRIQDGTAGLTIYQESGMFFDEVHENEIQMTDKIRVQGIISEQNFLKVIAGDDLKGFQRISRFNILPTPIKVTLAELEANGEEYESELITLDNLSIQRNFSNVFYEDRTYEVTDVSDYSNSVVVRIGNKDDTALNGMPFIENLVTFEGVLSQFGYTNPYWGYQLTPILPNDIRNDPVDVNERNIEKSFALACNLPNPFTSFTTIQYNIENADYVTLKVYNIYGDEISTLVDDYLQSGVHKVTFYPNNLSSGVYYYRLQSGSLNTIKQMILTK
jgi:hypothetical protein